jgi:hypothetical protein
MNSMPPRMMRDCRLPMRSACAIAGFCATLAQVGFYAGCVGGVKQGLGCPSLRIHVFNIFPTTRLSSSRHDVFLTARRHS